MPNADNINDVKQVANYFIRKALDEGVELTPLKLQKLLYFAYGLYLAIHKKPLFSDRFEVWKYGPVISQLYYELKSYGNQQITNLLTRFDVDSPGESFKIVKPEIEDCEANREVLTFLNDFWQVYKKYTAIQLANASHDGPWADALSEGKKVIDDTQLLKYFSNVCIK